MIFLQNKKKQETSGESPVAWQYFAQMQEFFGGVWTVNVVGTLESMEPENESMEPDDVNVVDDDSIME